jgi:hypothetical protein
MINGNQSRTRQHHLENRTLYYSLPFIIKNTISSTFYLNRCCDVDPAEGGLDGPPLKTPDKKLDAFINSSRACWPPDPAIPTNPSTPSAAVLFDPFEVEECGALGRMEILINGFGIRLESERFRRPRPPPGSASTKISIRHLKSKYFAFKKLFIP